MNKSFVLKTITLLLPLFASSLINFNASSTYINNKAPGLSRAGLNISFIDCLPISRKSTSIDTREEIISNDNRKPAGRLVDGILYLDLEVRTGNWYPESHDGIPIRVHAFAEAGKPLQLPGPLIRVPEGTLIKATIRN